MVTLELIRSAEVADQFRDGVRRLVAQPKPVAITGFGTATWRGAGDDVGVVLERGAQRIIDELLDVLAEHEHQPDGEDADE